MVRFRFFVGESVVVELHDLIVEFGPALVVVEDHDDLHFISIEFALELGADAFGAVVEGGAGERVLLAVDG